MLNPLVTEYPSSPYWESGDVWQSHQSDFDNDFVRKVENSLR